MNRLGRVTEGAGLSVVQAARGLALLSWEPMGKEEHAAFVWRVARPDGQLTIGDLYAREPWGPEHVHPSGLLKELAEEFDRTPAPLWMWPDWHPKSRVTVAGAGAECEGLGEARCIG